MRSISYSITNKLRKMPNRVTVIKTKKAIYTLFNETVHFVANIGTDNMNEDFYTCLSDARSIAFMNTLNCASVQTCEVDRPDFTQDDVLGFHKLGQFL